MRYLVFLLFATTLHAQMPMGTDTLYGNEWIDYNKTYLKISVVEEGIYQLRGADLAGAGLPIENIRGDQWQLFHMGIEQALYVGNAGIFGADDEIVFYAKGNGSELDRYVYEQGEVNMLNPGYSLVSDTAAYFLTWTNGPTRRYQELANLPDISAEPELFYMKHLIHRVTNAFVKRPNGVGSMTRFSDGEGFSGSATVTQSIDFAAEHLYVGQQPAELEIRMATNNSRDHDLLYSFNGEQIDRKTFNNFQFLSDRYTLTADKIQASNTLTYERMGAAENRYLPAYFRLTYPRQFVWEDQSAVVFEVSGSGAKKVVWASFGESDAWLFDPEQGRLIVAQDPGGELVWGFNQEDTTRYVQSSRSRFLSPVKLTVKTYENYQAISGDFIMMYHPDIRMNSQGQDIFQEYVDYRNGTGFQVIPVNVLELYDQFGYGVDRHFIALRNFSHFIKKANPAIEHLYIVGKGREFRNLRTAAQVTGAQGGFFIPTFGAPGSDQLLVCHNHQVSPIIGVGRIPVKSGDELEVYFTKVKDYETTQSYPIAEDDRLWMKRVLHLSGGNSAAEREQLRQIMLRTGRILENGPLQSRVIPFAKLSSEPVEDHVPTLIYDLINDGVSMVSFLGHSGSTTIDFNIENYNRYANRDKYFIFMALGCSVGNVHINGISLGERFVFEEDKAAIAFLASSGLGYPSILENYANRIYNDLGAGTPTLGTLFKDVHQHFRNTGNRFFQEQLEQMNTNGDPGLRYNYPEGPDLAFDFSTLKIKEGNVNISQDSFTVQVDVLNLGTIVEGDILLEVVRMMADGKSDTIQTTFQQSTFRKSLEIRLPVGGETASGTNMLALELNPDRSIIEKPDPGAYQNNKLRNNTGAEGFNFFVFGVSASPSWPPNLSVIQDLQPELKAVTGNLFAEKSKYIFELDTVRGFDTDYKKRFVLESEGGTLGWRPDQMLADNETYYWRISGDSVSAESGFNWEVASFSTATGEEAGLSMRHRDQFKPIENATLKQEEELGWAFGQVSRNLEIKNQVFLNNSNPSGSIEGFQYGSMFPWNVLHQGVLVQVLDPITGISWRNPPGGRFGSLNTTPSTLMFSFPYDTREADQRKSLIEFLSDSIPDGSIVFVYSIQRTGASSFAPEEWAADSVSFNGKNIFNVLESEGAASVRQLEESGSVPFIVGFVKGEEVFEEAYAEDISEVIDVLYTYLERIFEGEVSWDVPAAFSDINKAFWQIDPSAFPDSDSLRVSFHVKKQEGEDNEQFSSINENDGVFEIENTDVPTEMKFNWWTRNTTRYTTQLTNWTVTGAFLPDLTIYKDRNDVQSDTLEQGEPYKISLQIENLSSGNSDSTSLLYRVRRLNEVVIEERILITSLEGKDQALISIEIPTTSLNGLCFVDFQLNPDRDFPELRFDNNFGAFSFFIEGDERNPLVDVYFDGMDIMDGDLISSKPEIRIQLRDENPYFLLNDTSLFMLRLRRPSQSWEPITFSQEGISFLPATEGGKENMAEVLIQKEFMDDGEYILEVSARDVQGNQSGRQPYQKRFQVITKQMISNIVNYPNPFSTATQFVYTLTGSTSPDHFKIQIYSLSGQLVKEISHMEIGPLKVGTHVTDYVWDGTDQYGQLLANGVYLYRLQTQNMNEESVEHFETRLDQFVTNGWSKLVILR